MDQLFFASFFCFLLPGFFLCFLFSYINIKLCYHWSILCTQENGFSHTHTQQHTIDRTLNRNVCNSENFLPINRVQIVWKTILFSLVLLSARKRRTEPIYSSFFLYSSRSTDRIYIGVFKGFLYTINKHTQILYEEKMKIDWRRNGQREQRFNRSRILTIFRIVKRDLETKMCLISAIKCLAEWRTRLSCHIEISIFRKYCLYVYVCRWKIATLLLNLFNFSWTLCVCTWERIYSMKLVLASCQIANASAVMKYCMIRWYIVRLKRIDIVRVEEL